MSEQMPTPAGSAGRCTREELRQGVLERPEDPSPPVTCPRAVDVSPAASPGLPSGEDVAEAPGNQSLGLQGLQGRPGQREDPWPAALGFADSKGPAGQIYIVPAEADHLGEPQSSRQGQDDLRPDAVLGGQVEDLFDFVVRQPPGQLLVRPAQLDGMAGVGLQQTAVAQEAAEGADCRAVIPGRFQRPAGGQEAAEIILDGGGSQITRLVDALGPEKTPDNATRRFDLFRRRCQAEELPELAAIVGQQTTRGLGTGEEL